MLTLCALTVLAILPPPELASRAVLIDAACAAVPWTADVPCAAVVAVLWRMETNETLPFPQRGHGCGPLQVLAVKNRTPSCTAMRDPAIGLQIGARVWLKKRATALGLFGRDATYEKTMRFYNGSRHAVRYGKRAAVRLKLVLARCGQVPR